MCLTMLARAETERFPPPALASLTFAGALIELQRVIGRTRRRDSEVSGMSPAYRVERARATQGALAQTPEEPDVRFMPRVDAMSYLRGGVLAGCSPPAAHAMFVSIRIAPVTSVSDGMTGNAGFGEAHALSPLASGTTTR